MFRGVVLANAELGVRVVQVDEASQAYQADLRPEDLIISINNEEVQSIDQFALLSTRLKGETVSAAVHIFRNGEPHELHVHLYSYPILRAWGARLVPDFDIRFAQPALAQEYWSRLGRGYEDANKFPDALSAYGNALHNVPDDLPTALHTATLFLRVGHTQLEAGRLTEGIGSLRQGVLMLEKLFDSTLTDQQLVEVKARLKESVEALRHAVEAAKTKTPEN